MDVFPKRPSLPKEKKVKTAPKIKVGKFTKVFSKLNIPLLIIDIILEQPVLNVNSGEEARLNQIKAKQGQNALREIVALKNPSVAQVRTILKRNGLEESRLSNYEVRFLLDSVISIQNAKTKNKGKDETKEKSKDKAKQKGVGGKGWRGDPKWKKHVKKVGEGGTIKDLDGEVPTSQEAIDLINESGGKANRIEGPHKAPNPHNFNHINYTTPGGGKGTIKIK